MSETPSKAKKVKEKLSTKNVLTLFKSVIETWKKGKHSEAIHSALAIIFGITTGKLGGLMKEVEKRKKKLTEAANESTSDRQEEPESRLSKTATNKFRQGKLFPSIAKAFPDAEVQKELVPLKTGIMKDRPGAPGWTQNSTDDWSYEKAGNTDEKMARGIYSIEGTLPPDGYTRNVTGKVPQATAVKLTKIAVAMNKDPRMPLFKGIAMKVDGIEIMMVKEIHMHKRGTASTYLCQPHTGVSYIVKKIS